MNNYHTPVLLQEVLEYLAVKPGEKYIDCTLGGGGHTLEILKRGGNVLGIDVDQEALDYVSKKIQEKKQTEHISGQLRVVRANFSDIDRIANDNGFTQISGILMDLGVSSHQLDRPDRGFSFQNGPLDMRMDRGLFVMARDLVNGLTQKELVELFEKFGEERFAKKIARSIVERRKIVPIQTTKELADLIKASVYRSKDDIHPATRVFQALRIAVNDELTVLRKALPKAMDLLKPGGRLVVISFHSLEDRIVKQYFNVFEKEGKGVLITKKPVRASDEEVLRNRRARSAKLRCIEKL